MGSAQVSDKEHRLRLDRFLKGRLGGVGRGLILEWVRSGAVRVNGRAAGLREHYVKRGDRVEWPDAGRAAAGARPDPAGDRLLPLLHEDADLLAVDKPAGLPTNPSPAAGGVNALSLLERGAGRLHLVHRLDRDTSGALSLARHERSRDRLRAAFRARRVEKTYLAIVAGRPRAAAGSVRLPLLPHPRRCTRRVEPAARGGAPARTDFRVAERFASCARLEVQALSGRMHQVRAHLSAIGLPILGDAVYGRPHATRPPRLCLHALRLVLPHPGDGRRLTIEAPLPIDLAEFLERLRGAPHPSQARGGAEREARQAAARGIRPAGLRGRRRR